jgi:hypothetical protein
MLKPVVIYGRGAWYKTEKEKLTLKTWARIMLMEVYGHITEQDAWGIRTI